MTDFYILDHNGNPIPEPDVSKWGAWMESANRLIRQTKLPDNVLVSTVFLGLDHNHFRFSGMKDADLRPVLWETMIFGGPHDQYQQRYSSRAEAEAGHEAAVKLATSHNN